MLSVWTSNVTVYAKVKVFAVGGHSQFGRSAQPGAKPAQVLQSQPGLTKAVACFSAPMGTAFPGPLMGENHEPRAASEHPTTHHPFPPGCPEPRPEPRWVSSASRRAADHKGAAATLEPAQGPALFLPQEREDSERKQRSRLRSVFACSRANPSWQAHRLRPALQALRGEHRTGTALK